MHVLGFCIKFGLNTHDGTIAVLVTGSMLCAGENHNGSHKANSSEVSQRAEAQIWKEGSRQGAHVEPEVKHLVVTFQNNARGYHISTSQLPSCTRHSKKRWQRRSESEEKAQEWSSGFEVRCPLQH